MEFVVGHDGVGGHGGDDREQRQLLVLGEVTEIVESLAHAVVEPVVVLIGALFASQAVASVGGDIERRGTQTDIIRDEQVGGLAAHPGLPADEPPHHLAEKEFCRGRGGEDTDPKAGNVDPLGHHAHGHQPLVVGRGEVQDLLRCAGIVRRGDHHSGPQAPSNEVSDAMGVLLVGGDHEPSGLSVVLTHGGEPGMGSRQHVG